MMTELLSQRSRPAEILLVEDNPGDVLLVKKGFTSSKISNHIRVAQDGEEALEMLRRSGPHTDVPLPDLILLDLNMPRKDGKEVLAEIKQDPNLRRIPVIVLTGSDAETDVVKSYNLHANGYIVKPVAIEMFEEIIRAIENFWFTVVVLPEES